jgi:ketosteroid isomerase-like protein
MKTTAKKRGKSAPRKPVRTAGKSAKNAAVIIRQMGNDWARHWNAGILDKVVAAYAPDAVYLPPHREAIHGRDS